MGGDNPQISVIVPVYNNAEDVQRCLDSIAGQTYADWEAICVDDGSTDASGEILDQMAARDSRFKIIHQANGGVSRARNAGLAQVTAPYITMVDADDWLESNALEQLYTCMQQNPCDIVVAGWKRISKSKPPVASLPSIPQGLQNAEPSQFFRKIHTGPVAKLYKRDIIHTHNIRFPEGIVMGEDLLFNAWYWCYTGQVYCLKEAIYAYKESDSSVTRKFEEGLLPFSIYEMTIRLPYTVCEIARNCQDGVHEMKDWIRSMVSAHLTEQSWSIDDARHTWAEKRKLRKVSREWYRRMACHLKLSERFHITMHYYARWWRGRVFRVLGKIKRALKKMLRI